MNTGLADQLAFAGRRAEWRRSWPGARLAECAALKKRVAAAEKAQAAAERRAAEGELVRRKLHNTILVGAALHRMSSHDSVRLLRNRFPMWTPVHHAKSVLGHTH